MENIIQIVHPVSESRGWFEHYGGWTSKQTEILDSNIGWSKKKKIWQNQQKIPKNKIKKIKKKFKKFKFNPLTPPPKNIIYFFQKK